MNGVPSEVPRDVRKGLGMTLPVNVISMCEEECQPQKLGFIKPL